MDTPTPSTDASTSVPATSASAPTRPVLIRLLDVLSSVWFGVSLLAVIIVYMSVGSAIPSVRQAFELTEMAWFQTHVFHAMLGVFVLSIILVTVRRIRFNRFKAGVWMVHSGLVLLAVGCVVYFSSKVEGDVVVPRREVQITLPDGQKGSLLGLTGATRQIGGWGFQVLSVDPAWPVLDPQVAEALHRQRGTGPDKGRPTVFAVQVLVTPPDGAESYIRTILDGFPDKAQDSLPGQGGRVAVNAEGTHRVHHRLETALAPVAVRQFYIAGSAALRIRYLDGEGGEELHALTSQIPLYGEAYNPSWPMRVPSTVQPRHGPLDVAVATRDPELSVRVTGYLPYAVNGRFYRPATPGRSDQVDRPVISVSSLAFIGPQQLWIEPGSPVDLQTHLGPLSCSFLMLPDEPTLTSFLELQRDNDPLIDLRAPLDPDLADEADPSSLLGGTTVRVRVPLSGLTEGVDLPGTRLRVRLRTIDRENRMVSAEQRGRVATRIDFDLLDRFTGQGFGLSNPLPAPAGQGNVTASQPAPVAVDSAAAGPAIQPAIQPATQPADEAEHIRSIVLGFEQLNLDIVGYSMARPDPRVQIRLPSTTWAFLTAPGSGVHAAVFSPLGRMSLHRLEIGSIRLGLAEQDVSANLHSVLQSSEVVPVAILPPEQRKSLRDVQRTTSLIRVELSRGGWRREVWLSHVPDPHLAGQNVSIDTSIHVEKQEVAVPGLGTIELMYTREVHALPRSIELIHFERIATIGGENVAMQAAMAATADFISTLRFTETVASEGRPVGEAPLVRTQLNRPYWDGTYHYFQQGWDPASQSFTTLLIANRRGIHTMLAGVVLMVIGMLYAFYLKPYLQRRVVRAAMLRQGSAPRGAADASPPTRRPEASPA